MPHPPEGAANTSFMHFKGSVKKVARPEAVFDGLMGIFCSTDGVGDLSKSQQAVAKAALRYFADNNALFEKWHGLSDDETPSGGVPLLDPSVCDLKLADIPENGQHKRVGSDVEGLFCPVNDFDAMTHGVPLDKLVLGHTHEPGGGERVPVYFSDPLLEAKTFPCIYYNGTGCYHLSMYKNSRCTTMRPSHMFQARLRSVVDTWRRNQPWCFFQLDWMEKRRIHEAQGVMLHMDRPTVSGENLTLGGLASACDVDSDVNRFMLPSSIGGSKSASKKDFLDLCALVGMSGAPDAMMTLTCSEYDMPAVLERADGRSLKDCPAYVQEHFHRQFGKLFAKIKAGQIFGEITDHFVKVEYQHR